MCNMAVDFAGVRFKNPIVLASGTCGFGQELAEIFDVGRLGGICSKGLTLNPRNGNDGLRVWETAGGMLNSVGLENPGVEAFIRDELDRMNNLGVACIVNLGGHSVEDYLAGTELLNNARFDILELNISCPNVKEGGMNFGVKTAVAREVVRKVRAVCKHKLIVKLSPNAEDVAELAKACQQEGADGISLINTLLAMTVDIDAGKPRFANTYAGLSGPAIKPVALRMVHQAAKAVSIPIMGMGGVTTWQDAVEFIMAGAAVVQVGTATFMKPNISLDIIDGLARYMKRKSIGDLSEIRGIV